MKKKNLIFLCILLTGAIIIFTPNTVFANSNECNQDVPCEEDIQKGDIIVTKYRNVNGRYQYRHWNETKKCWVEDHWIDV